MCATMSLIYGNTRWEQPLIKWSNCKIELAGPPRSLKKSGYTSSLEEEKYFQNFHDNLL